MFQFKNICFFLKKKVLKNTLEMNGQREVSASKKKI